ncbi:unnamed protein product [Rhizophagus irregularis]|nr:unnamed protein product [Rhizophagus irregularis]
MFTQDSIKLYCSICKSRAKGFKNRSGLQRHETLKYMSYNTFLSYVRLVLNSELSHLKKAIIKELQKRLKNHHTAVGKQVFSIHCSEDAFVTFEEIGKILVDENWKERNYGVEQLSFVCLHMPEVENSNYEQSAKKSKTKSLVNGEITVQWKVIESKDKENHKFKAD